MGLQVTVPHETRRTLSKAELLYTEWRSLLRKVRDVAEQNTIFVGHLHVPEG
jgi:hypothetical protein